MRVLLDEVSPVNNIIMHSVLGAPFHRFKSLHILIVAERRGVTCEDTLSFCDQVLKQRTCEDETAKTFCTESCGLCPPKQGPKKQGTPKQGTQRQGTQKNIHIMF